MVQPFQVARQMIKVERYCKIHETQYCTHHLLIFPITVARQCNPVAALAVKDMHRLQTRLLSAHFPRDIYSDAVAL